MTAARTTTVHDVVRTLTLGAASSYSLATTAARSSDEAASWTDVQADVLQALLLAAATLVTGDMTKRKRQSKR